MVGVDIRRTLPGGARYGEAMTSSAVDQAVAGLARAIYFLDRGLAPRQKAKAFQRAIDVVTDLDEATLGELVTSGRITSLDGIGDSTGGVIVDSVNGTPSAYLARLDAQSAQLATVGAPMRALVRSDLHCHTTWSDGGASIRAMAENARALGHTHLAITDHSPRLTIAHGLSPERLDEQLDEIDRLNIELAPFRILRGMEVDILLDGSLDLPEESLARLDVVVASVHSKLAMPADEMTRRMVLAVASPHVDILGHCTGRQIMGTPRAPSRFDADLVFAACAQFATAVEINCRPERHDPPAELLAAADEWGCLFAIDCDAHSPGQMEWQAWGCDVATQQGIDAERIINTWDTDELLAWTAAA